MRLTGALPASAVAALGAVAYLLAAPVTVDLAAQDYRVWLYGTGALLWDNNWYAGHHLPGYGVLFAPLGDAIGVRLAGALAAIAATALFARLAARHWGERALAPSLWFAVVIMASVVSGRLTFTLGVAIGLGALLALHARRPVVAALLGAATALASPVAALFLVLAAAATALADRERRGAAAAVAAAAAATAIALNLLFPGGGSEPFVPSAFWPALATSLAFATFLPARERTLRVGAGLFALLCVAAFAVDNPLGGNATRLGALAAGPVLLGALAWRSRPALVAVLALPLAYWGLYPAIRDVAATTTDPSVKAAYHAPLVRFMEGRERHEGPLRVEIPFTAAHWEANWVARHVPLARGWERQADRKHNALFYDGTLSADTYGAWLRASAVSYVALPDVDLDSSARVEARMIERGLPYLREVWRDEHWRVFAVAPAARLVSGVAREIRLVPGGFDLRARRSGLAQVRIRNTRWWRVTAGAACIRESADGYTDVLVKGPGTVRVRARLDGSSCRG